MQIGRFNTTLSSKLAAKITALVIGLALLAGASLWGMLGLRVYSDLARQEYKDLEGVYHIGWHTATARTLCNLSTPAGPQALQEVDQALNKLESFFRDPERQDSFPQKKQTLDRIRTNLQSARDSLSSPPWSDQNPRPATRPAHPTIYLNATLSNVIEMNKKLNQQIIDNDKAAQAHLSATIAVIGFLSLGIFLGGIAIGLSQYRTVMRPLREISAGVQNLANGRFDQRINIHGDQEFMDLARDFNRMAAQLDELYHGLEDKVRNKSRELVRSERLASVGFLAAGVAHEINNPLSIISGYAEATLQRLRHLPEGDPTRKDMERALKIVTEEAFRCKEITQRLLAMARTGETRSERAPLAIDEIAREIGKLLHGLKKYRDRRLRLEFDHVGQLYVSANLNELKQVLLNLTINALESAPPVGGEVRIEGWRAEGSVFIAVADNGRGIAPETIEHIFEPFYTAKRGCEEHGTGLGLSIAHAIVTDHDGTITAESDGPNKGARFIIELPAVDPLAPDAPSGITDPRGAHHV